MELCSRIVSQVRLGHVQWVVRASWARLQGPQVLLESGSPWGALCSFPQDLQKRPCHHSSLLQMRKLSTNSKQVKLQWSLPAVAAQAASLRGHGDPARHSSSRLPLHPWCFPLQSTWAAASCLADGIEFQFFMPEYDSTAFKVYFCKHR